MDWADQLMYNGMLSPASSACSYPNDPPIELKGTQTIFALDSEHCLILSNLEYAQNPNSVDLTTPRENARYRGNSLVRTDAFIRTRNLSREEVIAINYVFKARARQYIAASEREWLYPEKTFTGTWESIGKVLLPKSELWRFGGEIFVGHKDGSSSYQDAFGRTSTAHKYLQKRKRTAPQLNDLCGCGSGHKFKKCCNGIPEEDRPSWKVYSIRERNLMFCRAVTKILGITPEKSWEDIRRELSADQVKQIHETFESLWPKDTDIAEILPRPDKRIFRALYMGSLDHRTVMGNITSWLVYFDEIIASHPFVNPTFINPEFSPTSSPEQHKEQTLRNMFLLFLLEPYIEAGLVHLIPDPAEFNNEFRKEVWEMANERFGDREIEEGDMGYLPQLAKDDYGMAVRRLPIEALCDYVRSRSEGISSEWTERVANHMKEQYQNEPCTLLQPIDGPQLRTMKGFNLELSMFFAEFTGAVIYTDIPLHWKHLHTHTKAGDATTSSLHQLSERIKKIKFILECNYEKTLQIRMSGRLGSIRSLLRRIGNIVSTDTGDPSAAKLDANLALEVDGIELNMHKEWQSIGKQQPTSTQIAGNLEISFPQGGFALNTVRRLILTFGRGKHLNTVPIAMFIRFERPDSQEESD